jgi:hypothetical protein
MFERFNWVMEMAAGVRNTGGLGSRFPLSAVNKSKLARLPLLRRLFERLLHLCQDLPPSVWLGQERNVRDTQPVSGQDVGGVGGRVKDALVGPFLQHMPSDCNTIASGHDHVDHEELDAAVRQTQGIEGLAAGFGLEDAVAFLAEDPVGYVARDSLVVNDEDSRGRAEE